MEFYIKFWFWVGIVVVAVRLLVLAFLPSDKWPIQADTGVGQWIATTIITLANCFWAGWLVYGTH